jgi:hypothetical protein
VINLVANECEFEQEGHCCPPKEYKDFICPSSVLKDGLRYCEGDNAELMSEEEYDLAEQWRQEFIRKMLP